jgi:hypothetical protein
VSLPIVVTVIYGRGSGVGVPSNECPSKNSTCCGLSDASPEVTTTAAEARLFERRVASFDPRVERRIVDATDRDRAGSTGSLAQSEKWPYLR